MYLPVYPAIFRLFHDLLGARATSSSPDKAHDTNTDPARTASTTLAESMARPMPLGKLIPA